MRRTVFLVATLLAGFAVGSRAQAPPAIEAALRAFWDADSPAAAEKLVERIAASGASFDAIASRLRAGRSYGTQRTGRIDMPTSVYGIALDNVVEVPADYDPARPIPLRVSLHGGVGRPAPGGNEPGGRPLANRIPGGSEIVMHPRAWAGVEWWKSGQVENVFRLLDRVKRAYNVDESHVYVTGISDGGTGVYFFAMRAATPWSACLPLNGHPLVLANPDTGVDGELFATNLANCPLHAVNGGRDRLYPAASVKPLIDMLQRGGIPVLWQVFPDADHNTAWWPEERARYSEFVTSHSRDAHPAAVSWTTERTDRYNRFRWLVIDELGRRGSDATLADVNTFELQPGRKYELFGRGRPSGRVDVTRKGNVFEAKTRGVAAFTLLLSPDVIDFTKPVQVVVNGRRVHDAIVPRNTRTLLKWAARDNDRTMLYAAELKVSVP